MLIVSVLPSQCRAWRTQKVFLSSRKVSASAPERRANLGCSFARNERAYPNTEHKRSTGQIRESARLRNQYSDSGLSLAAGLRNIFTRASLVT
jgi:hypothetical protein